MANWLGNSEILRGPIYCLTLLSSGNLEKFGDRVQTGGEGAGGFAATQTKARSASQSDLEPSSSGVALIFLEFEKSSVSLFDVLT